MNWIAKAATVSAFAGGFVLFVAFGYETLFPQPASMFFGAAYRVASLALLWMVFSYMVFVAAMIFGLWSEEKRG